MLHGRRISGKILTLLYLFGYINAKIYFFVEGDVYSIGGLCVSEICFNFAVRNQMRRHIEL